MHLYRIRLAASLQLPTTLKYPPVAASFILIWKFLDTDEETVRCGFSASDRFVNLPLVLVI